MTGEPGLKVAQRLSGGDGGSAMYVENYKITHLVIDIRLSHLF